MSITEASDETLENLKNNYRRAGKTDGGLFPLAAVLSEQLRRQGINYNGRDVARTLIELSKAAPDGLVTYREIWERFHPNKRWVGHKSMGEARRILDAAVHFCLEHSLPIMTAIVVQSATRENTDAAKANMCEAASDWGRDVGLDPHAFIAEQVELTNSLSLADIP